MYMLYSPCYASACQSITYGIHRPKNDELKSESGECFLMSQWLSERLGHSFRTRGLYLTTAFCRIIRLNRPRHSSRV